MGNALITLGLLLLAASGANGQLAPPEASLTVRVVDEKQNPIGGAEVGIGKSVYSEGSLRGLSDDAGFYTGTLRTTGSLFYGVKLRGYYSVGGEYVFSPGAMKGDPSVWKTQRWEPWNPTLQVVLKEKGVQRPMYAKRIRIMELPGSGRDIGFDLELGDWIEPHGKGKTADVSFTGTGELEDGSYRFRWTFSKPGDGIRIWPLGQGARSELKSPKEAPADGYAPSLEINSEGRITGADGSVDEKPACLIFRVRTVLDERGKIVTTHTARFIGNSLTSYIT